MFNLIKCNIAWIKDLFGLVFSGLTTIVVILTYRRAKETFLQPVRTEVIKKQTELLTNLLETLYEPVKTNIDKALDYEGLVRVNLFKLITDHGFILYNQSEIDTSINKEVDPVSLVFPNEQNQLNKYEIVQTFFNTDKTEKIDYKKLKYEKAKKGEIEIDEIFLTKKFVQYFNILNGFIENPFIPNTIKALLESLVKDINKNIKENLRKVLKDFMVEIFKSEAKPVFNAGGVYNEFNHIRIFHKQTYELLREGVRKYLRVDSVL